jgi:hypothetical protein
MFVERSEDMTQKIKATEHDANVLADTREFADMVLKIIGDDEINGQWVRMNSARNK